MRSIYVVQLAVAFAVMQAGCAREPLETKRMREICARTPSVCENGLIVAKYVPRMVGPVLEVNRFKCSAQSSLLQVTARLRNDGDQDFTASQDLGMTVTISDGMHVIGTQQNGLRAGVTVRHGADANGNQFDSPAIDFSFDASDRPAVREITVKVDDNPARQLAGWLLTLSWPSASSPQVTSPTPIDLANPTCSVSQ